MKQFSLVILIACLLIGLLAGCSNAKADNTVPQTTELSVETAAEVTAPNDSENASNDFPTLEDGVYSVDFNTDSGMFHVNEACEGKGTLTVKNGNMNVHISLVSKSIVNLYVGTAEEAKKDGAVLLEPTIDEITYKDGFKDKVYGFDVPVEALDADFPLAIIGKKGTWYDHTVSISNPQPIS